MPKEFDEAQALKMLAQGDERAFAEIYLKYSPKVYKEVYHYLRSSDLAKDLVQEIFTTVWVKREGFVKVDYFYAYLITMSKNLAYQYLLKISREIVGKKEMLHQLPRSVNSTEQIVRKNELEEQLDKAVNALPPQQKRVFTLIRREGLSYNDIADQLQLSPRTVKNHMVAALHFIRRQIAYTLIAFLTLYIIS
jgi:RNA polymerase sigma-70 factor (family 1)